MSRNAIACGFYEHKRKETARYRVAAHKTMNAARVVRLTGARTDTSTGPVMWSIEIPDGDPIESDEIYCNAGFYWILVNVKVNSISTMTNERKFEFDLETLTPRGVTLSTREHTHPVPGFSASSAGPRLVYQSPFQFWSYGTIIQGTKLKLIVEHPCNVELIAVRHANIANESMMELELR